MEPAGVVDEEDVGDRGSDMATDDGCPSGVVEESATAAVVVPTGVSIEIKPVHEFP